LADVTAWVQVSKVTRIVELFAAVSALEISRSLPRPEAMWSTVPDGMPSRSLVIPHLIGKPGGVPDRISLSFPRVRDFATAIGWLKHPMLRLLVGVLLGASSSGPSIQVPREVGMRFFERPRSLQVPTRPHRPITIDFASLELPRFRIQYPAIADPNSSLCRSQVLTSKNNSGFFSAARGSAAN